MGQPSRVPQTNILTFPPARAEMGRNCPEQSKVADSICAVAPQCPGTEGGYLLSRGDTSAPALFPGVPPCAEATFDFQDHFEKPKSPLVVLSSGLRLAVTTILLAVLPMLGAVAILRLGQADASPPASNHGGETKEVVINFPSISTRAVLKVTPGESAPFPIAIKGTDPVEGLGMIAISRLPAGSTLSAGVPQGETTWELKAGEIDNLVLAFPEPARGEFALVIQLLAPDGHVISDAATIVDISTTPEVRVHRVKTERIPAEVWDQSGQTLEAMDAEAEIVAQASSKPVPLPTRRPAQPR
jgi:hypothetical protein